MYADKMEMACQQQEESVKSSVEGKWNLAEAQQKLNSLALHNSESLDQEQARIHAAPSELRQREVEWRQKEEALFQGERTRLCNPDTVNQDVFNKSFINRGRENEDRKDAAQSFIQNYEPKVRHFGMLSRWNDSQKYLADCPDLVCEETAKYLILWCFHLEAEQKGALMEQVAHQAVVMQFIIEMAKSCNIDPRGCFRLFFQKAKEAEEGYLEVFKSELEAFKSRVRAYSKSGSFEAMEAQNFAFPKRLWSAYSVESKQQNADHSFHCYQGTGLCNTSPTDHREDDESKMMDTL
uniref:Hsp90 co-chaperone Cdc37-like 1 n=1 Tax=Geotrypetes seraphini TaxID=260995 RepID=A0A6P8NY54_GEOSA|nr:hsp90 co-chaperone Cdc37-like 1 [Geotrypetes seraphini]